MIIVLYVFGIAYIPNSHFIVQRRSCRVFGAPIFVAGNFYAGEIVCECGQIRPWKRLQIVVFRIVIALCDSKKIVGMLRPLLFRCLIVHRILQKYLKSGHGIERRWFFSQHAV